MQKFSNVETNLLWRPNSVLALLFSYFVLFGITIGTQGVIWADVLVELRLSVSVFGVAQLVSPLVAVGILLLGGQVSARFGTQIMALAGLMLLAASLIVLGEAGNLVWLLVALVLSGAGNALLDSAMNNAALDWERVERRNVINLLHAAFSAGAVMGAFGSGALRSFGWSYGAVLMLVALLCAFCFIFTVAARFPPASSALDGRTSAARVPVRVLFGNRALVILAAICLFGLVGESATNSFAVIYLRSLGAPALLGGVAFALFNAAMLVGRLLNAGLVDRVGVRRALIISALGHVAGGVLLVISEDVGLAVGAFLVTGIATAGVVPTVLSAAAKIAPQHTTSITSTFIAVVYVGFIIYPPLVGSIAEATSLHTGLLSIAVAGVAMLVLALRLQRKP